MLWNLGVWLALGGAAHLAGSGIRRLLGRDLPFLRREDEHLARVWLGLFTLASMLLLVSLFVPAKLPLILLLPLAARLPWSRGLIAVVAVAAVSNAGPVRLFDTGLYHHPLIEWLARFGTVPGMALFYHRLGFSSSWFALNAATGSETAAGGFVLALVLVHVCLALSRCRTGDAQRADLLWIGAGPVLLVVCLWQHLHVSPSPNWPAAVAAVVVGWLFLSGAPAMGCVCAGAALALKITLAPVAALAVVRDARAIGFASLAAAPLLLANVVATGYPFYPVPLLGLDLPWTLEAARVAAVQRETSAWARSLGTSIVTPPGWVWAWIAHPPNLLNVAAAGAALVWARGRLAWMGAAGLVLWLLTAPDLRLAFGLVALLAGAAWRWPIRRGGCAVVLALMLAEALIRPMVVSRLTPREPLRPEASWLVRPPPIRRVEGLPRTAPGFRYSIPVGPACWDAPFPCTIDQPLPADIRLCQGDKGVSGGFCRVPTKP